ncbi:MAG TPA: GAF domain-containing protein, partial [Myxococcota bacterium]|nr:GAF domain-containing protein [Myxococcota bacterium]
THGNPFFVCDVIADLARRGVIAFSPERRAWAWSLEQVRAQGVSDNVLHLLTARLRSLPDTTQSVVTLGASVGSTFGLAPLALATGREPADLFEALAPAVEQGVLVPLGEAYRYGEEAADEIALAFPHDKLREAAYELLSPEQARQMHLGLGSRLLAHHNGAPEGAALFEVADHLNRAGPLLQKLTATQRLQIVELDLRAAQEAKRAAAYGLAAGYVMAAATLLDDDAWSTHPEVMGRVQLELSEAEVLQGDMTGAHARLATLLQHTAAPLERAEVLRRSAVAYHAAARFEEAIDAALEALRQLDFEVPKAPHGGHMALNFGRIALRLRGRDIMALADAPAMSDPQVRKVVQTVNTVLFSAIVFNPTLWALFLFKLLLLSVEHGVTRHTGSIYCTFGGMMTKQNDYAKGMQFRRMAQRMFATRTDLADLGPAEMYGLCFLDHVHLPPAELQDKLHNAYLLTVEAGEPFWPGMGVVMGTFLAAELSVEQGFAAVHRYEPFFAAQPGSPVHTPFVAMRQMLRCIRGETQSSSTLSDATYDEPQEAHRMRALGSLAYDHYAIARAYAMWVNGHLQEVLDILRPSFDAIYQTFPDSFCAPVCIMMVTSLTGLAAAGRLPSKRGAVLSGKMARLAWGKVRAVAAVEGSVYVGCARLVEAELASLAGEGQAAAALYEDAIGKLQAAGYTANLAMAYERAAAHHARQRAHMAAASFARGAVDAWRGLGAGVKARALMARYTLHAQTRAAVAGTEPFAETTTGSTRLVASVEIPALVAAARAISQEKSVTALLPRLVAILSEVGGADRGVFLGERGGKLILRADTSAPGAEETACTPELAGGRLPVKLVTYVFRRQEALILDAGVARDGSALDGVDDTYLRDVRPKSVLCIPVTVQGQPRGVVYLEN